jgi:hypothetical protein
MLWPKNEKRASLMRRIPLFLLPPERPPGGVKIKNLEFFDL